MTPTTDHAAELAAHGCTLAADHPAFALLIERIR